MNLSFSSINKVKKLQKNVYVYIQCTLKNTLITVTNENKEPVFQISSKSLLKKSKRRNSPYILYETTQQLIKKLKESNCATLSIIIRGIGSGRYNVIKHLRKFKILSIEDRTFLPFNGCRPKKTKRR